MNLSPMNYLSLKLVVLNSVTFYSMVNSPEAEDLVALPSQHLVTS
jgi:hypothetical protein